MSESVPDGEPQDLTGIETRVDPQGKTTYRAYVKAYDRRKVRSRWGTYSEAHKWRELALIAKPDAPRAKRRRGEKKPRLGPGYIYCVRAGEDGPVKIGWTSGEPAARVVTLQSGNHIPLNLLGSIPGSQRDERDIHRMFDKYRIRGEWFALPLDVLTGLLGSYSLA